MIGILEAALIIVILPLGCDGWGQDGSSTGGYDGYNNGGSSGW